MNAAGSVLSFCRGRRPHLTRARRIMRMGRFGVAMRRIVGRACAARLARVAPRVCRMAREQPRRFRNGARGCRAPGHRAGPLCAVPASVAPWPLTKARPPPNLRIRPTRRGSWGHVPRPPLLHGGIAPARRSLHRGRAAPSCAPPFPSSPRHINGATRFSRGSGSGYGGRVPRRPLAGNGDKGVNCTTRGPDLAHRP